MIVRVTFVALLTLYPFAVYFGIQFLPVSFFGALLALLVALRFVFTSPEERKSVLPVIALMFVFAVGAALYGKAQALLYYPALMNVMLGVLFASSVRNGDPILLRIVRARGIPMSKYGPAYITRLTMLWAVFFFLNALVSLYTTTQTLEVWTLYNGLFTYVIVALLFVIELLYRRHYKKRMGVS